MIRPFIVGAVLLVPTMAAGQECLGVQACLFSPERTEVMGPPDPFDGCSVPLERLPSWLHPMADAASEFFRPACDTHDHNYSRFVPRQQFESSRLAIEAEFLADMTALCAGGFAGVDPLLALCQSAAVAFAGAVSAEGVPYFNAAQYAASSCACRQAPQAPVALQATPTGKDAVLLRWLPGVNTGLGNATEYWIEPLAPLVIPALATGSAAPEFFRAGLPSGTYTVRVRAANPMGMSPPSEPVTFTIGCGQLDAPTGLTGSVANGVASVQWNPVPGATSYTVQAGSGPGGLDIFNGNVGTGTSLSAGVQPGFRAYVRVTAMNSCGISPPSSEIVVGGQAAPTEDIAGTWVGQLYAYGSEYPVTVTFALRPPGPGYPWDAYLYRPGHAIQYLRGVRREQGGFYFTSLGQGGWVRMEFTALGDFISGGVSYSGIEMGLKIHRQR